MGAVKEIFMEEHDRAIELYVEAYLEKHPDATKAELDAVEEEACDKTADVAYQMMGDRFADMADMARMRAKEMK